MFASGQQRALVRLPRAAPLGPLAAAAAARAVAGGGRALIIADGAERAAAAYAALRAALPPGAAVGRIPGAPLRPGDAAVVADLRHAAAAPRAAWQLRQRAVQEGLCLAVLDEPLLAATTTATATGAGAAEDAAAGVSAADGVAGGQPGARGGGGGSSSSAQRARKGAAAAAPPLAARRLDPWAAAEQLLRDAGFLGAALDRRLLTVSGRVWEGLAASAPAATSASQVAAAATTAAAPLALGVQPLAYAMPVAEAIERGLLRPVTAAVVHTRAPFDASLLLKQQQQQQQQDGEMTDAGATASAALDAALCAPARVAAVADAYSRLVPAARALAFAASSAHARALAVALSLRGVPAAPLHAGLPPPERDAVLASFAAGAERVLAVAAPLAPDRLPLGAAPVDALLMAAPTADAAAYAARLAPGLLSVTAEGGSAGAVAPPLPPCVVVDFVDDCLGGGSGGGGEGVVALTCRDVLPTAAPVGADALAQAAAAAAAPAGSSPHGGGGGGEAAAAAAPPPRASPPPTTSGALEWVVLDDGSWAMPLSSRPRGDLASSMSGAAASAAAAAGAALRLKRGAGRAANAAAVGPGSRVLRLRRTPAGRFVPELEELSLGATTLAATAAAPAGSIVVQPLEPGRTRGMTLQAARVRGVGANGDGGV